MRSEKNRTGEGYLQVKFPTEKLFVGMLKIMPWLVEVAAMPALARMSVVIASAEAVMAAN